MRLTYLIASASHPSHTHVIELRVAAAYLTFIELFFLFVRLVPIA
jgi:hypothetical protein